MIRSMFRLAAVFVVSLWGAATLHAQDVPLANGVFLVAKPDLADPNFRETVVLITQPVIGGGPLGVVVNRPLAARLSEAVPDLGEVPPALDQLYGGGPVQRNHLLLLLRSREPVPNGLQVLADVYMSGDGELLRRAVRGEAAYDAIRVYAGHSGWAPGQLQTEIARGGWYVVPADAESIFAADVATVWPRLIDRITKRSTHRDAGADEGVVASR